MSDMPTVAPLILLLGSLAIYGTVLAAIVVFVQAIVRISHAFIGISRSLEEVAAAMRTRT